MRHRCYNEINPQYGDYGGRGIKVCEAWHDVRVFVTWAKDNGWNRGLDIERIDNDGDYTPDNCKFVEHKKNMRNRRITVMTIYTGKEMALAEAHELSGTEIPYNVVLMRVKSEWDLEEALFRPTRKYARC